MRAMFESTKTEKKPWFADGLRFTCTQCGNCCTGPPGYVWFNDAELERMAEHLGIPRQAFLEQYARPIYGRWSLDEVKTVHGYDCVLLERDPETGHGRCSVYPARPTQCRTWPFWPENLKSPRSWRRAARGCPGMAKGLEGEGKLYPVEHIRIQRDATP